MEEDEHFNSVYNSSYFCDFIAVYFTYYAVFLYYHYIV